MSSAKSVVQPSGPFRENSACSAVKKNRTKREPKPAQTESPLQINVPDRTENEPEADQKRTETGSKVD
jgi:hypothetical protein